MVFIFQIISVSIDDEFGLFLIDEVLNDALFGSGKGIETGKNKEHVFIKKLCRILG